MPLFQLLFECIIDARYLNIADIDECKKQPPVCKDGTCKNNPGSYVCEKKVRQKPKPKSVLQAVQGMLLSIIYLPTFERNIVLANEPQAEKIVEY